MPPLKLPQRNTDSGSSLVDVVRTEMRQWIAANWNPELPLVVWRERLADARWARPSWSDTRSGRGLPDWSDSVLAEDLALAGRVLLVPDAGRTARPPPLLDPRRTSQRRLRRLPRNLAQPPTPAQPPRPCSPRQRSRPEHNDRGMRIQRPDSTKLGAHHLQKCRGGSMVANLSSSKSLMSRTRTFRVGR